MLLQLAKQHELANKLCHFISVMISPLLCSKVVPLLRFCCAAQVCGGPAGSRPAHHSSCSAARTLRNQQQQQQQCWCCICRAAAVAAGGASAVAGAAGMWAVGRGILRAAEALQPGAFKSGYVLFMNLVVLSCTVVVCVALGWGAHMVCEVV
jgi:hypothetical protein